MTLLTDPFQRHLNYLRISITDHCNLNCIYCKPDQLLPKLTHDEVLSYEEILRVARVAVDLGVSKIRITGGEPMMRRGFFAFIARVGALEGLQDLSLTTNGVLLENHIGDLKAAGVRRLNISLDTLNRQRYREITGKDHFERVWGGIQAALEAGFAPIKINAVILRGINDDEIAQIAELSVRYPLQVRFIEYMPIGCRKAESAKTILTAEARKRVEETLGGLARVSKSATDGPARRYRLPSALGEVGFISALSDHFCHTCNRIRLTASGHLRPCLLSDQQIDVKGSMRAGCGDEALADLLREAALKKPQRHQVNKGGAAPKNSITSQMSSIGG